MRVRAFPDYQADVAGDESAFLGAGALRGYTDKADKPPITWKAVVSG
jgi:hypothetical protein